MISYYTVTCPLCKTILLRRVINANCIVLCRMHTQIMQVSAGVPIKMCIMHVYRQDTQLHNYYGIAAMQYVYICVYKEAYNTCVQCIDTQCCMRARVMHIYWYASIRSSRTHARGHVK